MKHIRLFKTDAEMTLKDVLMGNKENNIVRMTISKKQTNNEIWYTSSDGNVVTPHATSAFGANIVSNTYEDGQGIITFDGDVTSIGGYAFFDCLELESINIPNSVTSIGDSAFYNCRLTSITIPASVTSMVNNPFIDCAVLTSITVDSNNTVYNDGNGSNCIIETSSNTLIRGCKNTVIPDSVIVLEEASFSNCNDLTSITIPDSVTTIKSRAFNKCTGLTSVTIGNSVTSLGTNAFSVCIKLTSIISKAIKEPSIDNQTTFTNVPTGGVLYVPSGANYKTWMSTNIYCLGYYKWTQSTISE